MFHWPKVCLNYVRARLSQLEILCVGGVFATTTSQWPRPNISGETKAHFSEQSRAGQGDPRSSPVPFVIGNFLIKSFIRVMGYLHCEMPRRPATILDTCAIFVGVLSAFAFRSLPVPGYKYLIAKRICKTSALHNDALTSIHHLPSSIPILISNVVLVVVPAANFWLSQSPNYAQHEAT